MQLRFRNCAEKTKILDYYFPLEIQFLMHLYVLAIMHLSQPLSLWSLHASDKIGNVLSKTPDNALIRAVRNLV